LGRFAAAVVPFARSFYTAQRDADGSARGASILGASMADADRSAALRSQPSRPAIAGTATGRLDAPRHHLARARP